MTQQEFAAELKRTQPSVCDWERRGAFPAKVIGEVRALGRRKFPDEWNDAWLFEASGHPAERGAA